MENWFRPLTMTTTNERQRSIIHARVQAEESLLLDLRLILLDNFLNKHSMIVNYQARKQGKAAHQALWLVFTVSGNDCAAEKRFAWECIQQWR